MSAEDAYAAERRRRVLSRLVRSLGPRVAVIGDLPALRGVRPLVVCRDHPGGDVVARPDAVPVQSGALTGVVVRARLDASAAALLAECARLLQPGGAVLLVATCDAASDSPAPAAAAAGLDVVRTTPVGALPARPRVPPGLWGVDCALDRLSLRLGVGAHGPVEMVALLRRPGGDRIDIPGLGAMLGHMVLPRRRPPTPRFIRCVSGSADTRLHV